MLLNLASLQWSLDVKFKDVMDRRVSVRHDLYFMYLDCIIIVFKFRELQGLAMFYVLEIWTL